MLFLYDLSVGEGPGLVDRDPNFGEEGGGRSGGGVGEEEGFSGSGGGGGVDDGPKIGVVEVAVVDREVDGGGRNSGCHGHRAGAS